MAIITRVREKRDGYIEANDIYSRLLEDRIILIDEPITDSLASLVISELLYLEALDNKEEISIYINSPGGSVTAGLAIIDTMELIEPDISTICVGSAASMAAVILASGTKGKRYAMKRAEVLIHQVMGGAIGQAADVKIQAENILRKKQTLNELLSEKTGQDIDKIDADTDRDNYMTAEEAKEYGIIDEVMQKESRQKVTNGGDVYV